MPSASIQLRHPALAGVSALVLTLVALSACLGQAVPSSPAPPPFGLEAQAYAEILEKRNLRVVLELPDDAFDNPGSSGPLAWFAMAAWLEKRSTPDLDATSRILDLYFRAEAEAKGFVHEESSKRRSAILFTIARAFSKDGPGRSAAWEAALASLPGEAAGIDAELRRLEALSALGKWDAVITFLPSFAARGDLGTSIPRSGALLWFEAEARVRRNLGDDARTGAAALGRLLALGKGSWVARGMDLALELAASGGAAPEATVITIAKMRQAVEGRNYAGAYALSRSVLPAILAGRRDRDLVADLAKAWLFSGKSGEGLALMDGLGAALPKARVGGSPEWTAAWYKARMLKTLLRNEEAAALFRELAATAAGETDHDSALWFLLDGELSLVQAHLANQKSWVSREAWGRAVARRKVALIARAAAGWADPRAFNDLAGAMFRQFLGSGDWEAVEAFALSVGAKLVPDLGARSLYLAGRARELGFISRSDSSPLIMLPDTDSQDEAGPARPGDGSLASARYEAVLGMALAPDYYALVASARLGRDLPPFGTARKATAAGAAPELDAAPAASAPPPEKDSIAAALEGIVELGMPELAWSLASTRLDFLDDVRLLSLAEACSVLGQVTWSMRFANNIDSALGGNPRTQELLYPRPWLAELQAALGDAGIPEEIALGLVRSESWFDPRIKSPVGATGLAQLMPATAGELARKLRMKEWSLESPGDNLMLGMRMFRDLYLETGGRALRSAFAYNAGRTRLKRWAAESGGLPDDLFLETLSFEETRQYGRKIVSAAARYGALYYGKGSAESVRAILRPRS
ncbi:MAG: lytic transglycosylase domain-containing protein [Spirochaetota bacterium]